MQKAWYVDYDQKGKLSVAEVEWHFREDAKDWCSSCIHGCLDSEPNCNNNLCEDCAKKWGFVW